MKTCHRKKCIHCGGDESLHIAGPTDFYYLKQWFPHFGIFCIYSFSISFMDRLFLLLLPPPPLNTLIWKARILGIKKAVKERSIIVLLRWNIVISNTIYTYMGSSFNFGLKHSMTFIHLNFSFNQLNWTPYI